jgi:hypothetical protein
VRAIALQTFFRLQKVRLAQFSTVRRGDAADQGKTDIARPLISCGNFGKPHRDANWPFIKPSQRRSLPISEFVAKVGSRYEDVGLRVGFDQLNLKARRFDAASRESSA